MDCLNFTMQGEYDMNTSADIEDKRKVLKIYSKFQQVWRVLNWEWWYKEATYQCTDEQNSLSGTGLFLKNDISTV